MEIFLCICLLAVSIIGMVINNIWYKQLKKMNDDWTEYCIKITEEHYSKIDTLTVENKALKRKLQEDKNELS